MAGKFARVELLENSCFDPGSPFQDAQDLSGLYSDRSADFTPIQGSGRITVQQLALTDNDIPVL
jgi:hypothetical protein